MTTTNQINQDDAALSQRDGITQSEVNKAVWAACDQWHSLKPLPHSVKNPHRCNSLKNHIAHLKITLSRRFTHPPFIHRLFRFSHIGTPRS